MVMGRLARISGPTAVIHVSRLGNGRRGAPSIHKCAPQANFFFRFFHPYTGDLPDIVHLFGRVCRVHLFEIPDGPFPYSVHILSIVPAKGWPHNFHITNKNAACVRASGVTSFKSVRRSDRVEEVGDWCKQHEQRPAASAPNEQDSRSRFNLFIPVPP